jgi:hypothetical protein
MATKNDEVKVLTSVAYKMHTKECSFFTDYPQLAYPALKLYMEHELTCYKAGKKLSSKLEKLVKEFKKENGIK